MIETSAVRANTVMSDRCAVDELFLPFAAGAAAEAVLDCESGWGRRWSASFQVAGQEIAVSVSNLDSAPLGVCEPVRRFGWRARQRHRPGLQFMVSTGRLHGFESLEEQRLLLALDFVTADVVVSQPFRLRFAVKDGRRDHTPDFLAVLPDGTIWVLDVRPEGRVGERDRVCFAATAEASLAAGWRYAVVTSWRPHVMTSLDTLSSQRRELQDRLGLEAELLRVVAAGPRRFGELAAGTTLPAVARAHALHLLWHRELGIDLSNPLGDDTVVHGATRGTA